MLYVLKFGGSSVADAEKIKRAAGIVADVYCEGHDVVTVVSARGDATDELTADALTVNSRPSKRELDVLLSTGEQASAALMAMAIEKIGLPVVSLTGKQIGINTDSVYGAARIKSVSTERLRNELDRRRIVIAAGFQGINKFDDITTLGRGGSDTTAVAVAAALHADRCLIYTDVEGVYTADPRNVQGAEKLAEITYDEMLELASLGAQVLHNRSVEMAKRYGIRLEVLSNSGKSSGTIVKEVVRQLEEMKISGVAKDKDVARIAVIGVPDEPGMAFRLFRALAKRNISVDIILQSYGKDGTNDISFTVAEKDVEDAEEAMESSRDAIGYSHLSVNTDVAKISIVGAGMISSPGIAATMFEALYDAKINIHMISTSEIKISVLIDEIYADSAVTAIHGKFFGH